MKPNFPPHLFVILILIVVSSCNPKKDIGWNTNQSRTLSYQVHIQKGLRNGAPEMDTTSNIQLKFLQNGIVEIDKDGITTGQLKSDDNGVAVIDVNKVPDYNGIILYSLIPASSAKYSIGDTSQSYFPSTSFLSVEIDKLAMQDRYSSVYQGKDRSLIKISITGESKLVKNNFPLDISSGSPLSGLLNFNLFLTGTALYDPSKHAVTSCELFYLFFPVLSNSEDSIKQSIHLQHVTMTLN